MKLCDEYEELKARVKRLERIEAAASCACKCAFAPYDACQQFDVCRLRALCAALAEEEE